MFDFAEAAEARSSRANSIRRFSARRLRANAQAARADRGLVWTAAALVIVYNMVGAFDVATTNAGLIYGFAEEANPIVRMLMAAFANQWALAKLALQVAVSGMILWFPHRIVLVFFGIAVLINLGIVVNNFRIIGIL